MLIITIIYSRYNYILKNNIYLCAIKLNKIIDKSKFMTVNEALNEHIKSLPNPAKRELVCNLLLKLDITPAILNNWRYSLTPIKSIYLPEIIKIVGKDIFANVTK